MIEPDRRTVIGAASRFIRSRIWATVWLEVPSYCAEQRLVARQLDAQRIDEAAVDLDLEVQVVPVELPVEPT